MKTTWAIEKDIWDDNSVKNLKSSLKNQDIPFFEIGQQESYDWYKIASKGDGNTLFYGSIQIAEKVKEEANWIPGVFYSDHLDDCVNYYPALGDLLLNADRYVMLPYGDLLRQKEFLFDTVAQDGALFIRPNSGKKDFTGKMIYKEHYEKDVEYLGFYDVTPDRLVIVSSPKNIVREWRFVICDEDVVTGSLYKENEKSVRKPTYPQEALKVAEQASKRYKIDRVWVCDVCETKLGEFYVLEIGCFSCAGLYQCNMDLIAERVSEIAAEEYIKNDF